MKIKLYYISILVGFYLLLPILILLGILSYSNKFFYLIGGALVVYVLMRIVGIQNKELGITSKHLSKSIKDTVALNLTIAIIGVFLLYAKLGGVHPYRDARILYFLHFHLIASPRISI